MPTLPHLKMEYSSKNNISITDIVRRMAAVIRPKSDVLR
jgi:hypothetical protein